MHGTQRRGPLRIGKKFLKSDSDPVSPTKPEARPFRLSERFASFRFAVAGLLRMVRTQHNTRVHLAVAGIIVTVGFVCEISTAEWCWIIAAIAMVWITEALNTAVEYLGDAVTTESHPQIGHAKDVAAGSVLLAAVFAVLIGLLVLGPHLFR